MQKHHKVKSTSFSFIALFLGLLISSKAFASDLSGIWQGKAYLVNSEGYQSDPFMWDLVIDYDAGENATLKVWDNPHYISNSNTFSVKGEEIWNSNRKVGSFTSTALNYELFDEIFGASYLISVSLNADGTLNYGDMFTYSDGFKVGIVAENLVKDTKETSLPEKTKLHPRR